MNQLTIMKIIFYNNNVHYFIKLQSRRSHVEIQSIKEYANWSLKVEDGEVGGDNDCEC